MNITKMTTSEKLQAAKELCAELTRNTDACGSPAWHGDVLRERDKRVAEGKETYMKWEDAKRELRRLSFPSRSKISTHSSTMT